MKTSVPQTTNHFAGLTRLGGDASPESRINLGICTYNSSESNPAVKLFTAIAMVDHFIGPIVGPRSVGLLGVPENRHVGIGVLDGTAFAERLERALQRTEAARFPRLIEATNIEDQ